MPHGEQARELREASRFWELEDAVAAEIAENGTYLRTRSYTDMATEAALDASEQMLQSASLMDQLHGRLESRTAELKEWRKTFRRAAERKLEELVGATTGRLRSDMVPFAERHWRQDKEIGALWNRKVEEARIKQRLQGGLQELVAEMQDHLKGNPGRHQHGAPAPGRNQHLIFRKGDRKPQPPALDQVGDQRNRGGYRRDWRCADVRARGRRGWG